MCGPQILSFYRILVSVIHIIVSLVRLDVQVTEYTFNKNGVLIYMINWFVIKFMLLLYVKMFCAFYSYVYYLESKNYSQPDSSIFFISAFVLFAHYIQNGSVIGKIKTEPNCKSLIESKKSRKI